MIRTLVQSSDLQSVGYDPATQVLEIAFHRGGIYQYRGVPEAVYRSLMQAPSHGTYFHAHIKERYPYHKVG